MSCYVYILECNDGSLYTGITRNTIKRIAEHNLGLSKATKSKLPVKLKYQEKYLNRIEAAKREREIKGWSRIKKLQLISEFSQNTVNLL